MAKVRRVKRIRRMQDYSLISIVATAIVLGGIFVYLGWTNIYGKGVDLKKEHHTFYIHTGSDFDDVCKTLFEDGVIKNPTIFKWIAKKKKYIGHIKPGYYKIPNKISKNKLLNILRSGNQEPIKITFNNIRTIEKLASVISTQIEADSIAIISVLNNKELIDSLGFTETSIPTMFIPETYEVYWSTTASDFVLRMHKEYIRFWNDKRKKSLNNLPIDKVDVSILASIIDEETADNSEKACIAGVYINRLNKGMPLQADPTVKYALGDITIKRILKKDLKVKSPYNTYLHKGVPPGPLRIPSKEALDAVLNYDKHNYLYFCANSDFSGTHVFAKNLIQHNRNSALYHRALSKNRIYR